MTLRLVEKYCDRDTLYGILDEMGEQILADHESFLNVALLGIIKGGASPAAYLADYLSRKRGSFVPVSYLDITLYRDDMIDTQMEPYSRTTEIPFSVKNKEIILVDDVLFTGRTIRAALTSILEFGRPRAIKLAAVVDRGFREMPIQADYVGRKIKTTRDQGIRVKTDDQAEEQGIFIYEKV